MIRQLLILLLLIVVTITTTAQYEVIARLGEGRFGNASFSPDNSQLAVATSTGVKIYDLSEKSAILRAKTPDKLSPLSTPARLVTYTFDGRFLVYVEPINFRLRFGGYPIGYAPSFRIWQASVEDMTLAEILGEVYVEHNVTRIDYMVDTNQLVFSQRISSGKYEFAYFDLAFVSTHNEQEAPSKISWINRVEQNSALSFNGNWRVDFHSSADDERLDYESYAVWYDLIWTNDGSVIVSSLDEVDELAITISPDRMYWTSETSISIVEDIRCGTVIEWNWHVNSLSTLDGYGGCGDDRSCQIDLGDYCIGYGYYDPIFDSFDDTVFRIAYDWYYLDQHPETINPDFEYIVEGHTDSITIISVPLGQTVMSGSNDNTSIVWSVNNNEDEFYLSIRHRFEHHEPVSYVGFINGHFMTSSGGDLYFWDTESGDLISTLEGHSEPIIEVAKSFFGDYFATASSDGVIFIWAKLE